MYVILLLNNFLLHPRRRNRPLRLIAINIFVGTESPECCKIPKSSFLIATRISTSSSRTIYNSRGHAKRINEGRWSIWVQLCVLCCIIHSIFFPALFTKQKAQQSKKMCKSANGKHTIFMVVWFNSLIVSAGLALRLFALAVDKDNFGSI